MKTLIFVLFLFIGCSETPVESVKPVTDSKAPNLFNLYVIDANGKYGGDSIQVSYGMVTLFRAGEIYLQFPPEYNPLISIH